MEQIKRTKAIKIRLTDEEHERLKELQQGNELATWMRTTCLNIGAAQQAKADPQILRELNKIGVNMNQIARAVNNHRADYSASQQALSQINDQLDEIIKTL